MFRKVLVPLDGSRLAECALPYLKKITDGGMLGEVLLLTVEELHLLFDSMTTADDINASRRAALDKDREYLAGVQADLLAEGIKVETEVIEANDPAETIIDVSRKKEIDLIVMATHGYTGVKKMLMGSVAFRVLHESHAPVLLVRPEAAKK